MSEEKSPYSLGVYNKTLTDIINLLNMTDFIKYRDRMIKSFVFSINNNLETMGPREVILDLKFMDGRRLHYEKIGRDPPIVIEDFEVKKA